MTTETYEALHKSYVKNNYKRTNKRDFDSQILAIVGYMLVINEIIIFCHFVHFDFFFLIIDT
jgi:hypothetical protein